MHTTAKIIRTAKIGMSRNSDRFSILNGLQASSHDIAEPLDDKSNTLPLSLNLTLSVASRPWCRVSNNPREGVNISRNESNLDGHDIATFQTQFVTEKLFLDVDR